MVATVALLAARKGLARQYLREIAQLAAETDTAQPAAAEIVNSELLLAFYNQPGMDQRLMRDVQALTQCRIKCDNHVEPAATFFSLRAITLGHTSVLRDGQTISAREWRSSTARELFFYLVFNGPSQRDQIASDFWPEGSSEQIRSNFHTALKRARHALGENVVTFSDEIYALNPEVSLSCDALELESLIAQARGLSSGDARTEDLLTRAVRLYDGELLPEVSHQWAAVHREKYYDLCLEGMISLAACAKYRHDFKTALQLLKRVLKLEPYREDVHRLILQLYADRGEKRKVLNQYRTLLELLKNDLGSEPGEATRQLFQHLMD
jgi:two-component SAPR family response regulator